MGRAGLAVEPWDHQHFGLSGGGEDEIFEKRQIEPAKEGKRGSPQFQRIYRICVIFWSFSPLYILLTGVSPVFLTLTVSALVVGLVPILTLILMKITSEKSVMGKHRNSWTTNALLICLTLAGFYMIYVNSSQWIMK